MENASKALLIAAGVLIVILLIAFGMLIFNSAGDTSSDAQEVGQSIAQQSQSAASALKDTLGNTGNNKKIIRFAIKFEGDVSGQLIVYEAEEGMTWYDWVNSEYNIDNWKTSGNGDNDMIYKEDSGGAIIEIISDNAKANREIISNKGYIYTLLIKT